MFSSICFVDRPLHIVWGITPRPMIPPSTVQLMRLNGGDQPETLYLDLENGLKAMVGGAVRLSRTLEAA